MVQKHIWGEVDMGYVEAKVKLAALGVIMVAAALAKIPYCVLFLLYINCTSLEMPKVRFVN